MYILETNEAFAVRCETFLSYSIAQNERQQTRYLPQLFTRHCSIATLLRNEAKLAKSVLHALHQRQPTYWLS